MLVHGLREKVHDIDLIARGVTWKIAKEKGESEKPQLGDGEVVRFFNADIEIFNSWAPGKWNIDELIDTAETHQGYKFVTLTNVLKWKKMMMREKDLIDIKKIEKYLAVQKISP